MTVLLILIALFFVCVFARFYRWTATIPIVKWPKFNFDSSECASDADCPLATQKCFRQTGSCKVAAVTDECEGGTWVLDPDDNSKVKCQCDHPDLVGQYLDGANCSVDKACGVFGRLSNLADPASCECYDPEMVFENGQCVYAKNQKQNQKQKPPVDCSSSPDQILSDSAEAKRIFDPVYLAQFDDEVKCLRLPCSFNAAVNGKRLKHAQLVVDANGGQAQCACDPRYGNYGVRLDVQNYLKDNGDGRYNACASIYQEEPLAPDSSNFSFYCYFYVPNRPPVCFLTFDNLKKEAEVAFPGGSKTIAIDDRWPHTYDQFILGKHPVYVHRQYCAEYSYFFSMRYSLRSLEPEKTYAPYCDETPRDAYYTLRGAITNNVYKDHFVCKLRYDKNDDAYKAGRVIVNPYCLEVKDGERPYSHGYRLYMKEPTGEWHLKPAPTPFPDQFQFGNHAVELMGRPFSFIKKADPHNYAMWPH